MTIQQLYDKALDEGMLNYELYSLNEYAQAKKVEEQDIISNSEDKIIII